MEQDFRPGGPDEGMTMAEQGQMIFDVVDEIQNSSRHLLVFLMLSSMLWRG